MNKIKPLDRQSLLDVALQTSGGAEAAFGLSLENDISISAAIAPDSELATVAPVDKNVLNRYEVKRIRPATEVRPQDEELVPFGGIGLMGVEIDFVIS